ncbi:MAG TPA: YfiR family protein [Planctomycetes bacterium]|nr:YfiR family protein [Planctomycetota bacterium]
MTLGAQQELRLQTAPRRFPSLVVTIGVWMALLGHPTATVCGSVIHERTEEGGIQREYRLKAAFIYRICQYVTLPSTNLPPRSKTYVIGLVGPDPYGAALDALAGKKSSGGRVVQIQRYRSARSIGRCQVLIISPRLSDADLRSALKKAHAMKALTISDRSKFAAAGGMIALAIRKKKLRFDVNLKAAKKSGITVSARLLRLADTVIRAKESH